MESSLKCHSWANVWGRATSLDWESCFCPPTLPYRKKVALPPSEANDITPPPCWQGMSHLPFCSAVIFIYYLTKLLDRLRYAYMCIECLNHLLYNYFILISCYIIINVIGRSVLPWQLYFSFFFFLFSWFPISNPIVMWILNVLLWKAGWKL